MTVSAQVGTVRTRDAAHLHVRCYGEEAAPLVVFVHGYGARLEYWEPQVRLLVDRFRVIVYDQRGLGRSSMGARGVAPDVLADDLEAVLADVVEPGRRAVLVGHSFGGITVMAFAERHPEQLGRGVSAALLANTIASGFPKVLGALSRMPAPMPPLRLMRPLFQRMVLSRFASRPTVDYTHGVVAGCPRRVRAVWGLGLRNLDVTAGARALSVPTTVISSGQDRLTSPEAGGRIAEILRGTGMLHRHVEFARAGHCSNLEEPHAFSDEIARLAELEVSSPRP
ncbi:alpha/beta fold hydrolase [Mycolicibacterium senegalense]|uniref:alpha/beta fold hydrolase n=1 Tax=Mycolicibacterium TaxID=1866885 RepID=UPI0032049A9F